MSWHSSRQQGHALIGMGVLLIMAAQVWSIVPAVTAIALIGRGAILTLQANPQSSRNEALILVNLAVYGVLIALAIAAQSNAVLQEALPRVSLAMLLDHALAIVLLSGLIWGVFSRLSQPTT